MSPEATSEAMPADTKFDLMADLCILAGQAVMQTGSDDLRAAMRVVLGTLGHEVAARFAEKCEQLAKASAPCADKSRTRARARPERLRSCA